MAQPVWKRGIAAAAVFSLFSFAACGGEDTTPKENCEDAKSDCDKDGVSRGYELANGLNPDHPDTNGNAILDGDEIPGDDGMPHSALDAIGDRDASPLGDADGDGIPNLSEAWYAKVDSTTAVITRLWNPGASNAGFQCAPTADENPFFSEMAFVFDSIQLTLPGTMGPLLAGMMNADMNSGLLNVVTPTRGYTNDNCVALFRLGAGSGVRVTEGEDLHYVVETFEKEGGEGEVNEDLFIQLVDAVVVQIAEDKAFFRTTVPLSLVFPGFLPSAPGTAPGRFLLPLSYITAAGTITRDLETNEFRLAAVLDGAILYDDAEKTEIRLSADAPVQTIAQLLRKSERYTLPGSTEEIGFKLRGTFTAGQIDLRTDTGIAD